VILAAASAPKLHAKPQAVVQALQIVNAHAISRGRLVRSASLAIGNAMAP
jgi:hypothetical protein